MTRRLSLTLLLVALLLAAASAAAEAPEPTGRTIFYNLTTDETWSAGMAMGQAAAALKHGYGIVVFLNVRGVYLADKARAQDGFSGTGKDAHQMLADLMAAGARVIICPMCMRKAGLAEGDLIDGIELGGPQITLPVMTDEATTVLSY